MPPSHRSLARQIGLVLITCPQAIKAVACGPLAAQPGARAPPHPSGKNHKAQFGYNSWPYKACNIIARMFNRVKDCHHLARRTFRTTAAFRAAARIAAIVIWYL